MRPFLPSLGIKTVLGTAILSLLLATDLRAVEEEEAAQVKEEAAVSFAFETDFASHYVWRGFVINNGPVLQPLASLSVYDFTLNLWSNFVLEEDGNQGRFTEIDPSLDYYVKWGRLEIQPSFEYFFYLNQDDSPSTGELSLWLAYPIGPVRVFTDQVVDVVSHAGAYYGDIGVDYERDIFSKLKLTTAATLVWASAEYNDVNAGTAKTALNAFLLDLGFVYRPFEVFYLRPHAQLGVLINQDLRAASANPTIISGGLALGVSF